MKEKTEIKQAYCNYCKRETPHRIVDRRYSKDGTGGALRCSVCGSARLDTIQGFNASLM